MRDTETEKKMQRLDRKQKGIFVPAVGYKNIPTQ